MSNSMERKWTNFGFDVWYNYQNVRDLKKEINKMHASNKNFLSKSRDGMVIDDLVDSYLVTSKNSKERTVRKKNKQRFGVYFLIHLRQFQNISMQVKILHAFLKQVCMGEENLPYFATTSRNGQEVYIHLWICDREYGPNRQKVYDRDYYIGPNGYGCKADTEGAVLKGREGQPQFNKDGTPKMTGGWSANKTRIFSRNLAENAIAWRDAFIAAFYSIMRHSKSLLKFKLNKIPFDSDEDTYGWVYNDDGSKRFNAVPVREFIVVNRDSPTWKKDKYRSIAQLQYFIKSIINELFVDDFDNYTAHRPDLGLFEREIDIDNPPTKLGRALKSLFDYYNKVFNDWEFWDGDNKRKIMYETSAIVSENLLILRDQFKDKIDEIVTEYNLKLTYVTNEI